jgi:hypothetical protein
MEITKKAAKQYVELAAEMSRKLQAVDAELAVLKQAVAAASGGCCMQHPNKLKMNIKISN